MKKAGASVGGKQRWMHGTRAARKICSWQGTNPVGLEAAQSKGVDRAAAAKLHKQLRSDESRVRRYVVTAAQNATPVHEAFFKALLTYCKVNRAQLIVIPYRYKNPTSHWSEAADHDDWWASELVPYLLDRRLEVSKNLVVLGDIKTQPTATAPLQGFDTLTGGKSAIIGHPKLELTTVPTPQQKLPKVLTTTGAVTVKNYLPSKAGKKAEHHHTFGAAVLECKGDVFHLRQLNALRDGSFQDLVTEYRADGHGPAEVDAIVLGDEHEEFVCPLTVGATYGKGGMVDALRPKYVVHHDVHDFYARNHHHRGEVFVNFAKHHAGLDNVERALQKTFAYIDRHTRPWVTNVFVPSNHPDALARWVKEADPKSDPENAIFWARTFVAMCEGAKVGEGGAGTIDPFAWWGRQMLRTAAQARFLRRDESFLVRGIELGMHGDRGPNGARGARDAFGKIGVKSVVGHSHSPGIKDGCYQTGTMSKLRLEYNSGPSSWLNTHCLVYANGKRSLVSVIEGEWRA